MLGPIPNFERRLQPIHDLPTRRLRVSGWSGDTFYRMFSTQTSEESWNSRGGQNNCGTPQRNLNAMVNRKGSNSGQFKRKNSFAPAEGKRGPRTQALYAMWDNENGNSVKSYSQS